MVYQSTTMSPKGSYQVQLEGESCKKVELGLSNSSVQDLPLSCRWRRRLPSNPILLRWLRESRWIHG